MDTMYKFQPVMQLARKIDKIYFKVETGAMDEIKSKENLINNIKSIFK